MAEFDPAKGVRQNALFKCDCGGKLRTKLWYAINGNTKSCGCLRGLKLRKAPGQAELNYHFSRTRDSAAKRGLAFEITLEQFKHLATQCCKYCGAPPVFQQQRTHASGMALNGVDRVENEKGYLLANLVPCCWTCNQAKHGMSVNDFKSWIGRVAKHLGL